MEKTYPNWQYAFAGVMWAVISAALYLLHYKVYGGLLLRDDKQLLWMLILLPPVLAVTIGMRQQNEPHTRAALPLGFYGFLAHRDGARWCVAVSVAQGSVEIEQKQDETVPAV